MRHSELADTPIITVAHGLGCDVDAIVLTAVLSLGRYDINKDGSLDRDEVRRMLEDVREATTGNRSVSSEDVQEACAELMGGRGGYDDAAEAVSVSKEAFFKHCQKVIRRRIMS